MKPEAHDFEIANRADAAEARRAGRELASRIGFDEPEAEEIAIVISELASNIVKHARRGALALRPVERDGNPGVEIEATDEGPGLADPEAAIGDGFTTTGSLGCGLGAVNRLLDELEVGLREGAEAGLRLRGRRWIHDRRSGAPAAIPLHFGVATRPHAGMTINGDSFVACRWKGGALAGVVDGLGHGAFAHRAAETARHYLEMHREEPVEALFRGTARACRPTRGVVMAVARFEVAEPTALPVGGVRLSVAALGNVEVRFARAEETSHLSFPRGIVGFSSTLPRPLDFLWVPGDMLILASDGLDPRWKWTDFPGLRDAPAARIAETLLKRLGRDDDDATVLVVKSAA